jgi:hypothetical protein
VAAAPLNERAADPPECVLRGASDPGDRLIRLIFIGLLAADAPSALTMARLQEPFQTLGLRLQPCRSAEGAWRIFSIRGRDPISSVQSAPSARCRHWLASTPYRRLVPGVFATSAHCWHFSAFAKYRSDREDIKSPPVHLGYANERPAFDESMAFQAVTMRRN